MKKSSLIIEFNHKLRRYNYKYKKNRKNFNICFNILIEMLEIFIYNSTTKKTNKHSS